jgi:hypothetical protein
LHKSLTDFYQAKKEDFDEETEQETLDIPFIETVPPSQKYDDDKSSSKKLLNFTPTQCLIKKACLFPSFSLIQ